MYRQATLDKQMSQTDILQTNNIRHTDSTDKYCKGKITLDKQTSQINIVSLQTQKNITNKYLTKKNTRKLLTDK